MDYILYIKCKYKPDKELFIQFQGVIDGGILRRDLTRKHFLQEKGQEVGEQTKRWADDENTGYCSVFHLKSIAPFELFYNKKI